MDIFQHARWISKTKSKKLTPGYDMESSMLRKCFVLSGTITKATLYACGLGQAVYHLNGKRVTEDVYVTHFTKYDSRVLYNQFDVTNLVSQGHNAIAVHLGNGFYNDSVDKWNRKNAPWRAQTKLLLALWVEYENGETQVISSDSSWKACDGPVTFNNMMCGEVYDARLLFRDWDLVCCDESGWTPVILNPGPGGILDYVVMPPIRVVRQIRPERISENLYDCGEVISGRARIWVRGSAGDRMKIKYAEALEEDGSLSERINALTVIDADLKHTDAYILAGTGTETFAAEFVYHGFRYVQVTGSGELVDLVFEDIHNDFDIIGEFQCSDPMINEIHMATRRSTLSNYMDIPTDCPHREQNGWTGDALISCEQSLMNYEIKDAYRKWMKDFQDAQRPSGQLPGIIPSAGWGYNWGSGPAWDSAIIMIPFQTYQNTGDDSLIRMMWPYMKRYMEYMCSMEDDYIVDYGLGDWCPPDYVMKCPSVVTDTGYFYANARIMAKCCAMMGEEDQYTRLAERIKESWRRHFMGEEQLYQSQTFVACGIYWGLFEDSEIPDMAAKLAKLVADNDYHIDCGILGSKYIFTALSEYGYADVLYKMVTNPACPSYVYWILQGRKNLCEQWAMVNSAGKLDSLDHHMFSEVDNWFYKYLAGIRIDETGAVIRPCFVAGLDWVKAHHRDVSVYWDEKCLKVETGRPLRVVLNGQSHCVEPGSYCFDR